MPPCHGGDRRFESARGRLTSSLIFESGGGICALGSIRGRKYYRFQGAAAWRGRTPGYHGSYHTFQRQLRLLRPAVVPDPEIRFDQDGRIDRAAALAAAGAPQ